MKKQFSTAWKSSKQPRKQRKYVAKAPLHIKRKLLSVNLSKELRTKFGRRNIPVRKGDNVKVMTGKFKGKTGKIIQVFTKKSKVTMEGIQVKKQDGSKANIKLHPSNLQIIELNTDDKKRIQISNKKTESKNKTEKKE
jgi:large subunit ribosomal protein L24